MKYRLKRYTDGISKGRTEKMRIRELEDIFENLRDGLLILDKHGRVLDANPQAKEMFKIDHGSVGFGESLELLKSYDMDGSRPDAWTWMMEQLFKGEKVHDFRVFVHRAEGRLCYSISGSPILDGGGNLEKAVVFIRDMTGQVAQEELIRQQKQELEAIIDNIYDPVLVFDKLGDYKVINKAARESRKANGVWFKNIRDVLTLNPYRDSDENLMKIEEMPSMRVLKGETITGFRQVVKKNDRTEYKEVNGSPIYDSQGNFVAGVLISRDITDRVKYEEALIIKKQYEILKSINENLELGICRVSYPDFRINDVNLKAFRQIKVDFPECNTPESLVGLDAKSILGAGFLKKLSENPFLSNSYSEVRTFLTDGDEVYYRCIHQPLYGMNNEIIELISIWMEITEEVRSKRKVEAVLRFQEQTLVNVSHELKTPLNLIFTANQMTDLYLNTELSASTKEAIMKNCNIIQKNCYRFMKLINNIMDSSKIEAGFFRSELINADIVSEVENIIISVSDYIEGQDLKLIYDSELVEKVMAYDPEMLERILLNLLSNALKFSKKNGMIKVEISQQGRFVEIAVRDEGIGIEADQLEGIFNRFQQVDKSFSRKHEGSGIGLSLVKSFVELHDGHITVESEPGKGSSFIVCLPDRLVDDTDCIDRSRDLGGKTDRQVAIEFSDIYRI